MNPLYIFRSFVYHCFSLYSQIYLNCFHLLFYCSILMQYVLTFRYRLIYTLQCHLHILSFSSVIFTYKITMTISTIHPHNTVTLKVYSFEKQKKHKRKTPQFYIMYPHIYMNIFPSLSLCHLNT